MASDLYYEGDGCAADSHTSPEPVLDARGDLDFTLKVGPDTTLHFDAPGQFDTVK